MLQERLNRLQISIEVFAPRNEFQIAIKPKKLHPRLLYQAQLDKIIPRVTEPRGSFIRRRGGLMAEHQEKTTADLLAATY